MVLDISYFQSFGGQALAEIFHTDDGHIVNPTVNGEITVTGAGTVTTQGAGSTITITGAGVPPIVAETYTTDAGNAVPAANVLNVLGGVGIHTTGAGNTLTITNTAPAVPTPTPANICSFSVYLTDEVGNVTGDSTKYYIPFDGAMFNIGNNYNLATHTFTAPINGMYMFVGTVTLSNLGAVGTTSSMNTYLEFVSAINPVYLVQI